MKVKVGVSNRHVHLSEEDFKKLFGDSDFYSIKDLSQKGEFMSNLMVTLKTEKGSIERVRVVGPIRKRTQVEISKTDAYKLGIDAPIRLSGDLDNSADIMLSSETGDVLVRSGCIIAKRHIHVSEVEAVSYGLVNDQIVKIRVGGERSGVIDNVVVRIKDTFSFELHLDTDEANAFNLKNGDEVEIMEG